MSKNKLTPEIIKKAKNAKSISELEDIAAGAGIDYSKEQLENFAQKLGIIQTGKLDDDKLGNIAGGRSTVNNQEIECNTQYGTINEEQDTKFWEDSNDDNDF